MLYRKNLHLIDTYGDDEILLLDTSTLYLLLLCKQVNDGEYWFCMNCCEKINLLTDFLRSNTSFSELMNSVPVTMLFRSYDEYDIFTKTSVNSKNFSYPKEGVFLKYADNDEITLCLFVINLQQKLQYSNILCTALQFHATNIDLQLSDSDEIKSRFDSISYRNKIEEPIPTDMQMVA